MNPNITGSITETKILLKALECNYIISIPYGGHNRYDQIWDKDGKLIRIQIKTSRWKDKNHKSIIFSCYSVSNGHKHIYTKKDVDYFATYWNDKCYLIPISDCKIEKTLWLEPPKNKLKKCSYAKDYELI